MSLQPWSREPTPWGGPELDDDLSGYDWADDDPADDDPAGVDDVEWEQDDGPPCTCSPTHEEHCASLQRRSWWARLRRAFGGRR